MMADLLPDQGGWQAAVPNVWADDSPAIDALKTLVTTAGPLPDGLVIEVRPVQYQTLADLSGVPYRCPRNDEDRAAAVATFNAKYSPALPADVTTKPADPLSKAEEA